MSDGTGSAEQLATLLELAALRRLIEEQAQELIQIQQTLSDVVALCDLGDWADAYAGTGSAPTIRVSDLRRALRAGAAGAGLGTPHRARGAWSRGNR